MRLAIISLRRASKSALRAIDSERASKTIGFRLRPPAAAEKMPQASRRFVNEAKMNER